MLQEGSGKTSNASFGRRGPKEPVGRNCRSRCQGGSRCASRCQGGADAKPPPKSTGKAKLKPPLKATGKPKIQGNEGAATPQPQFEITADVDLYDSPGGGGTTVGTLNGGDVYANVKCRADKWCQVPDKGCVWGDFVKAL